ncbi:MAG: glycosyltransferase family 2 protein [Nitrospinales bacterium]
MWRNNKVVVIFPTYNEKDSLYRAIEDFLACEYVDEVIVVNNNATPGTDDEVKKTRAVLVHESVQGYGSAIQCGFREALKLGADLIILSEPDGTFSGHDCLKLLAYSDDFPVVYGSRTSETLIWKGANMGFFLKWGNFVVAKMMEFLFNTSELSDVGCTMRLIHRSALEKILNRFTIAGSHFGPEMMLLIILHGIPFVEIPVNYLERVGVSSVTGSFRKALINGIRMILLILKVRIKTLFFRPDDGESEWDYPKHGISYDRK